MIRYSKWARLAAALCALWLGMSAVQASPEEDGCRLINGIWVCD